MPEHPTQTSEPFAHPLLAAAGCPPSGNGALTYVQQLVHALEACQTLSVGTSASEWMEIAKALKKAILTGGSGASASPTPSDLVHQPWGNVHACIDARAQVRRQSSKHLDALMGLMLLAAAAGGKALTAEALSGLKTCYSALSGKRKLHVEWELIANPLIVDEIKLKELLTGLSHPPVRAFGHLVLGYLAKPMPTPAGVEGAHAAPVTSDLGIDLLADDSNASLSIAYTAQKEPTVAGDMEEADDEVPGASRFQRGDSLIDWHHNRAQFSSRNNRLGLESWQTLSIAHVCLIAAKLPALLADPASPMHQAAILVTASLLTSTPGHVLLHARLIPGNDLWMDIQGQRFCWSLEMLRAPEAVDPGRGQTWISIPFPLRFAEALLGLSTGPDKPTYFGDLLVQTGPAAWQGLIRQAHDLLMVLGDAAFPAYPGRWANSLSRVYLQTCHSDLLASVCTLDLAITPTAALYYFHPAEEDIGQAVSKVYQHLGLGEAAAESPANRERAVPTDVQLKQGFLQLEERAVQLDDTIRSKRTDLFKAVAACNELAQLTAAMCVFLIGGRGSRVEEITCGALWCDTEVIWLEDKKVEHEGASRILPKTSHLRYWLNRLLVARQRIAERIVPTLRRDLAARWKEMASGLIRFDAPAFELIELSAGKAKRSPVTASDVEAVAQRYFQAGKNVMRHVLITHWALEGEDRHLLRLITGHARSGLAVPAAGAMYTPRSAVLAAGEILEKQLTKWVPEVGTNQLRIGAPQFVNLPGKRILKVHGAYRAHMQTWDAPAWSRWHLAANRIMNRLRAALLSGQGPKELGAQLWLHLVCFDGLNEPDDLQIVISHVRESTVLSAAGWLLRIKRDGSNHQLVIPVQAPTALLLQRLTATDKTGELPYLAVTEHAEKWVAEATPDCWSDARTDIAEALLACSRLWADWVLPPAVQMCYSPDSHAPLLDDISNATLYGLPRPSPSEPISSPEVRSHPEDLFKAFFKAINRLGSSQLRLGERRQRARRFELWVKLGRIPQNGHLANTLIQVVGVNVGRIKAGKKGAIEWSSQATYFSNLRPFLERYSHQSAEDFDALDWLDFCRELQEFANQVSKQTVPANEAAAWLMRCLQDLGYPLPQEDALTRITRQPVATTTTAIPAVSQGQIDTAKSLISNLAGTPIESARFNLALHLLSCLPLRQGELSSIHTNDVTLDRQLCITTHGFSHLKSHAARRRLPLRPDAWQAMQSVRDQALTAQSLGSTDSTMFGSHVLSDGTAILDTSRLMQTMTWAIQSATENHRFRIHTMRAHVVSNLLCPGWQDTSTAQKEKCVGPQLVKSSFTYEAARAWATDSARLIAGHASIRTTLSYYFHAWIATRTRALMATLADSRPTDFLLTQVGVTCAALTKACSRNSAFESDPWAYLIGKLPIALAPCENAKISVPQDDGVSSPNPGRPGEPVSTDSLTHKEVEQGNQAPVKVRYLGLRMLGLDRITASNLLGLQDSAEVDELDFRLAQSSIDQAAVRGRIKGDIGGRALRADLKFLLAPSTTRLIGSLAKFPLDHVEALLQLLLPRQNLLTWDTDLALVAPWLDESDICIEVVSDIKSIDPSLNLRLSRLKSVLIGSPAHDLGALPRLFIQPRDTAARNTVAKARWTTLIRVLCSALLILHSPQP